MSMQIIQKRSAQPDPWPAAWPTITDSTDDAVTEEGEEGIPGRQQVGDFLDSNTPSRLLVGFGTWLQHRELFADIAEVGIVMDTTLDLALLDQGIQDLSLIKVVFQGFNDGKGYSIASILRSQYNYRGELRAANVVKENLALLEQCGFDSYEMVEGTDLDQAIEVFDQLVPDPAA